MTSRKRLRRRAIATSSTLTTAIAMGSATLSRSMMNGSEWNVPPRKVAPPVIMPRAVASPRPLMLPSSESASERPMLIPAPSDAARPTRSAACGPARNAVAKIGASVETVPSIRPISAG